MEERTLHNSDESAAKVNVKDIVVFGNTDQFKLLFKASSRSQGWMKATKAMEIEGVGCVVQVSTQQRNPNGSYTCAESVTFVPNTHIVKDASGGRTLVSNS